ncbi:Protein kinase superfamily protein [Raphanus sativus]|nr:Protein kinase superfamily protein [Raphanus sativus]
MTLLVTAAGLQVLRDNNIIHRDLKPQVLSISLNPVSRSKSVCNMCQLEQGFRMGSSLLFNVFCSSSSLDRCSLEALQKHYAVHHCTWHQKLCNFREYDAKLLQNILRSTGLQFPADCRDLSLDCIDLSVSEVTGAVIQSSSIIRFFRTGSLHMISQVVDWVQGEWTVSFSSGSSPSRNMEESSQEDCLPFLIDDDFSGPEGSF